ncbi:MAG: hydroxymethylglutaryl-CoA lyase [Deinococcales bacterium]
MNLPDHVELVEVGLRDGLQSQRRTLPTSLKLRLLGGLLDAGLKRVQVASFVHPKKVPQMADAEALCAALPRRDGVVYSGLTLNRRGVERAAAAGLTHVDLSYSGVDAHSRRNAGMPLDEAEAHVLETVRLARRLGLEVRGGIQCVFGCLGEPGPARERLRRMAEHLVDAGVEELALADSAGNATPVQVEATLEALGDVASRVPLILHLHDTRGAGLANLVTALQGGVRRFDTAFGGLGGCPFIPGAAGNIATEDTAHLLHGMGVQTGVDVEAVAAVSARAEEALAVALPSRLYGLWKRGRESAPNAEEGNVGADHR